MKLKYTLKELIVNIIILMIILTPIFNLGEVLNLFIQITQNIKDNITPIYIKVIKDFLIIVLVLLLIKFHYYNLKINNNEKIFLLFILLSIPSTIYMYLTNKMIFLSGIRWSLPLLLTILLIRFDSIIIFNQVSKTLKIILVFHFIIQIIQFFTLELFGVNFMGLSLRNPGIFLIPNTAGAFSIFSLIYMLYASKYNLISKWIKLLLILSTLLSGSSTAILILFFIIFINYFRKYIVLLPIFVVVPLLFGYQLLELMRPGVFNESLMPRINLLFDNFINSGIIIGDFGAATNTAVSFVNVLESSGNVISADSFWGGLPVNLGLLLFLTFFSLNLLLIFISFLDKKVENLILFASIFLFSFTSSLLESYPVNIIISILLAHTFSNLKKERSFENNSSN